jgi:hypothetical protein
MMTTRIDHLTHSDINVKTYPQFVAKARAWQSGNIMATFRDICVPRLGGLQPAMLYTILGNDLVVEYNQLSLQLYFLPRPMGAVGSVGVTTRRLACTTHSLNRTCLDSERIFRDICVPRLGGLSAMLYAILRNGLVEPAFPTNDTLISYTD